jgi:hypothetical protein
LRKKQGWQQPTNTVTLMNQLVSLPAKATKLTCCLADKNKNKNKPKTGTKLKKKNKIQH